MGERTTPYFALSRPISDGREFFAGVYAEEGRIATSAMIFKAFPFATREEAETCAAFLTENDLLGFTASELSDGGTSDNLGSA